MSARQPHELLAQASAAPLIPTSQAFVGGMFMQTTSARDLHAFLKVGKDFSSWMKARIEQFDFVENSDFVVIDVAPQNGGAGNRGARVEYALTLDMAKELSMVERNAQGKQARQYLIECERRALASPARPAELSRMDLIELAMAAERERIAAEGKVQKLEHQVADQAPAVAGFNLIASTKGTLCITDAAKALQMKPHQLTDLLLDKKWMYHRPGKPGYIAYQEKLDVGYLKHKYHNYQDPDTGENRVKEQVLVTNKGLTKLSSMIVTPAARDSPQGDQRQLDIE